MKVVVTGGAGFIGANLSYVLAKLGHDIVIIDNLSREGSEKNLRRLISTPEISNRVTFADLDIRDRPGIFAMFAEYRDTVDSIVHLAAQTTVTESITRPFDDFDINACGTLSLLEAARKYMGDAHLIFTSTNKVYGDMVLTGIRRDQTRYRMESYPDGIPETFPTQAISPYGCSKLAADCYVRDYGRTFGMSTTVLRLSCVYGNWQNGTVGQGWVSWFVRSSLAGRGITVYGDGFQTRDLLHISDLTRAMTGLINGRAGVGETFNVGGGIAHTISIWEEFGPLLEDVLGHSIPVRYEPKRVGDQDIYISDNSKISNALSWSPIVAPERGVLELLEWIAADRMS